MSPLQSNTAKTNPALVFAILLFGMSCSAVSFVFIRESVERSIMLASWRVLLAAIIMLPLYLHARKRYGDASLVDILKRSVIPGAILAVHFMAWVAGARLTPGANATLIVCLMPVVMPFFMYFMFKEQLQRRELIGTALAMVGVAILTLNDVQISRTHFHGDVLCFGSMILFAAYLTFARKRMSAVPNIWLYVVPMYAIAGLISLLIAAATGPVMPTLTPYNLLMVFLLAALSTVIGHTALNYAMQKLRGQTVTLTNLLQFVVAGIAGFLIYQEVPSTLFYVSSSIIVCGLLIAILGGKKELNETRKTE